MTLLPGNGSISGSRCGGSQTRTVVVGFDGTASADHALLWAAGEAARTGGKLLAVHIRSARSLATAAALGFGADCCYLDLVEAADADEGEIAVAARRAACELRMPIDFVATSGRFPARLIQVARDYQADLIVVGRARGAWHRRVGWSLRHLGAARDAPIVVVVP